MAVATMGKFNETRKTLSWWRARARMTATSLKPLAYSISSLAVVFVT